MLETVVRYGDVLENNGLLLLCLGGAVDDLGRGFQAYSDRLWGVARQPSAQPEPLRSAVAYEWVAVLPEHPQIEAFGGLGRVYEHLSHLQRALRVPHPVTIAVQAGQSMGLENWQSVREALHAGLQETTGVFIEYRAPNGPFDDRPRASMPTTTARSSGLQARRT